MTRLTKGSSQRSLTKTDSIWALVVFMMVQFVAGCSGIVTPNKASTSALSVTSSTVPTAKAQTAYSATLTATGGTAPYTWSMTSGTLPTGLALAASGTISGMPTQVGNSSFTVQVMDSSSPAKTAMQPLSITVAAATAQLQIGTTSIPSGQVGVAYATTLLASGGTTPYSWTVSSGTLPAGMTLNAATGQLGGTPTQSGTFAFIVQVKDASNPALSATQSLSATIAAAGTPLSITSASVSNGQQGVAYSATLSAKGGTTPYTWSISSGALPSGISLNSASGALSGTPTQSGTFYFTAKVIDSGSPAATASANLSIVIEATTLQVSTTTLPAGATSTAYDAVLAATGGTAPYTWSVLSGSLPGGLTLSASGQITGTPTTSGSSTFTAQVKDSGAPAQSASKSFTISIALKGGTLQVTTVSLANGQVGVAYTSPVTAVGGVQPYAWSVSSGTLPGGLAVNNSSSMISGTPTASGSFTFTLQVKDSSATPQTATKSFTVTISSAVVAVSVTTGSLSGGQVSSSYAATLAASGGTTPYTWSLSSGTLPAGLTLAASTGQISGTPTAAGTSTFAVQVKDSSSPQQTATKSLTITVTAAVTPVTISTSSVPSGQVGTAYSTTLAASGGTTPYTWNVSSGALPGGVTLSTGGTISGTPTASGSFSFTVKVTDSTTPTAQTASKSFTITVAAAVTPVTISTSSVPAGQVGTAYSTTLTASGGTTPYSWSVSSGALPGGLTLSSGGTISGTPTASGSFTFTAKVTDSTTPTAQTATKSFTLTIAAAVTPVTISTGSVPSGQVGTAYSTTLAASGGTTPYTWSVSTGALPGGLTLSSGGTISGTPTASGSFTFTAKVTDSTTPTAQTATKSFTLTVAAAVSPVTITTSTLTAGQVGVAYSTTLAASGGTTPYSWSLSSGILPAGLSLSTGGTLSGTPTTAGSFTFTIKVTDSTTPTAQTATKSLTFTAAAANGPVQITTISVPAGQVSVAYSTTLQATEGTTPYTWSISSGSLPAGLTLSSGGTISGTPTATGSSSFTVKVTDSGSPATSATASFSITVSAGSGHSVTLNWTASPSSGVTGYNVYRSTVNGSGYAKINPSPVAGLTYTDGTVAASQTYYYVTTAVDAAGDESGYSEVFQAVIP
ncbi:MAG: putative Ig domain-containing protein [Candidatus Acidiferrum sp.]